MLSFIVAVVALPQTDFKEKVVDLTVPAARVEKVVAALAEVAKAPLKVGRDVQNEIVVLHVKQAKTGDIMQKLAQAAGGQWEEEQGTWILVRPASLQRAQEREDFDARLREIRRAQSNLRDTLSRAKPFDKEAADALGKDFEDILERSMSGLSNETYEAFNARTPATRAASRIIEAMAPETLAAAQNGHRVVLSTHPTSAQVRLPESVVAILRNALTEQAMYIEGNRKFKAEHPQSERNFSNSLISNPVFNGGRVEDGVATALVVVSGWEGNQSINLSFSIYDREKKLILQGSSQLGIFSQFVPTQLGDLGKAKPEFRPETILLAQAVAAGGYGPVGSSSSYGRTESGETVEMKLFYMPKDRPMLKLPENLRQIVLNPDTTDPLSFAPSDTLIQVAKDTGKNLVVSLPDGVFLNSMAGSLRPNTNLQGAFNSATRGVDLKQDSAWLTGKPDQFLTGRLVQAKRPALGNMLRTLDKQGFLSLDTLGSYAASGSPIPNAGITGSYARMLNSTSIPYGLHDGLTWDFIKLWGSLRDSDKRTLRDGGKVAISELVDPAKGTLHSLVYSAGRGPGPYNQFADEMMTFGAYEEERTIKLPRGLPGTGYLEFSGKRVDAVLAIMSNTGFSEVLDHAGLASYIFHAQNEKFVSQMGQPPAFDRYQEATMGHHRFVVMLAPDYGQSQKLQDAELKNTGRGDYQSLPAAFRDLVSRQVDLYRKLFSDR